MLHPSTEKSQIMKHYYYYTIVSSIELIMFHYTIVWVVPDCIINSFRFDTANLVASLEHVFGSTHI